MDNYSDIAIGLVLKERDRQNSKWGQQNHDNFIWLAILSEEVGETSEAILHERFGGDQSENVEKELIHAVAVGLQWIECIERNKK